MEKLCGKWTSDITDLICEVIAVYHVYENGDVKAKYHLYNKKNGISYERKTVRLPKKFFDINTKVS